MAAAERSGVQLPRARPSECTKKRTISRAKRSAATPCSALRSRAFGLVAACADHPRTLPHRHDGRQSVPRPPGITPCTTGLDLNHAHRESPFPQRALCTTSVPPTPCITCSQHNERLYHTLHNGLGHDGTGTTRVQDARFAPSTSKKEWQSRCHGCRTAEFSRPPDGTDRSERQSSASGCQNRPDSGGSAGTTCSASIASGAFLGMLFGRSRNNVVDAVADG
jgi:hypothetical protein